MIFAIDATNWGHVLYHAQSGRRVVENFLRRLDSVREIWAPELIVCGFDVGSSFRKDLEPSYKGTRKPIDVALLETLDELQAAVDASCAVACSVNQFEADDVLATVARICMDYGRNCVIASPDKDLRQCLVDGRVSILKIWKTVDGVVAPEWLTARRLMATVGLRPDQWIDCQSMVGDAADNIAGWDGVGAKSAVRLLREHGTLETILANPWKCKLTKRQVRTLPEFAKRLCMVRELVTLCDHVPWVLETLDLQVTP